MKSFTLIILTLAALTPRSQAADPEEARPNILYIYVDDLGWGSMGPNGQHEQSQSGRPALRTPNLDRLGAEGLNFTRAYGCTVCSPARASQQSGFHQGHTFADRNDPDNAKKAMRADEVLIGDALSEAGYTTGYWGKWGFGGSKNQENPKIVNVQTLPTSHGYQHVVAELHHVRAHTFFQPTIWRAPAAPTARGGMELIANSMAPWQDNPRFPEEPAHQNHEGYPETAYIDDVYAFSALDFVREHAAAYNDGGRPFFGLLAVQVPHAPFGEIQRLPNWNAAYKNAPWFEDLPPQAQQWAAMVSRIDGHIGLLLDALEDPNGDGSTDDSVAENTLVLFQSDNGGPEHAARQVFNANGGLRGSKGSIYEGGIRVPTILRWPKEIHAKSELKPGANFDHPTGVEDWLPTFCDLAQTETPLGVDGVSLAGKLLGEPNSRKRDFLIHEAGGSSSIIRGNTKFVLKRNGKELYNLDSDPDESENILDANGELADELEQILVDEHVLEPKGFATTYHQWIGGENEATESESNWSDYVYENEGITYLVDRGAPKSSWIASMIGRPGDSSHARVSEKLEVLALEIRGAEGDQESLQELSIFPKARVIGRNEIRVGAGGHLSLWDGIVRSQRTLEIRPGGSVSGFGIIDCRVENAGILDIRDQIRIYSDYVSSPNSQMRIGWAPDTDGPIPDNGGRLSVLGTAKLAGTLNAGPLLQKALLATPSVEILRATSVEGRFDHPNDIVETTSGQRFQIRYTPDSVLLIDLPENFEDR